MLNQLGRANRLALLIVAFACSGVFAQDETLSDLEAAKELSAASGRPIFAVAGSST